MTMRERNIVRIDEDKCNGCGLCATACHEGAIHMVDGKAKLVSDIYCDGLGDCLAPCPTGAISIVSRPAEAYDEAAVADRMSALKAAGGRHGGGCPGATARELKPRPTPGPDAPPHVCPGSMARALKSRSACSCSDAGKAPAAESELMNWPVQLRLVPPGAPYLKGADILMAADCAAFAVPDFHRRYLRNKPVVISCPKLEDNEPQIEKIAEVIAAARPASITVLRMEVPCCGGLARNVEEAVRRSGLEVPVKTVVVGIDGSEK